jgi:hypothetical protein
VQQISLKAVGYLFTLSFMKYTRLRDAESTAILFDTSGFSLNIREAFQYIVFRMLFAVILFMLGRGNALAQTETVMIRMDDNISFTIPTTYQKLDTAVQTVYMAVGMRQPVFVYHKHSYPRQCNGTTCCGQYLHGDRTLPRMGESADGAEVILRMIL